MSPLILHALFFLMAGFFFARTLAFRRQECGTYSSSARMKASENAIQAESRLGQRAEASRNYTFDLYFTVIASDVTLAGGWVPDKQIEDQVEMLQKAYRDTGTGISWNYVSTTRVISRYWHETVTYGTSQAIDMAQLFRKGRSNALNVYTVGFYTDNLNGYSSFPGDYRSHPYEDGVVLLFETLPGGASKERQGGTLIHEAGHWLGLYHTFQDGCTGVGDMVEDTPASAQETYGCPTEPVDSCVGDPGLDPIHNYMDYTDDTCRTEFTPGQIERMKRSVATFRSDPNI